jgi:D-alanyl-D-alanine dipeptidase
MESIFRATMETINTIKKANFFYPEVMTLLLVGWNELNEKMSHLRSLFMYFVQRKKLLFLFIIGCCIDFGSCCALSPEARAKDFVYLHEVDPTILVSLRYKSNENFIGKPIDGYKKSVVIMTKQAAESLKLVQKDVKKNGYSLVVYDAYRPQQAVNHFVRWAEDVEDQPKKIQYYPHIGKARVFQLGYVSKRSGHSRGSTIDLTLIENGKQLHAIQEKECTLLDGSTITLLDDGTVDMGSSFDLFDEASHFENNLIEAPYKKLRRYLRSVMEKHGFKGCVEEWWHFTLKKEPFPANQDNSYFDFVIE